MKNKTSCGYDGLSNKILNLCGSQISKPFTYIYNKLLSGICPDCLKYAIIKLCFKKGDKSWVLNYRSISLLTGSSKIYIYIYIPQPPIGQNIIYWVITLWPMHNSVFVTMFLLKVLFLNSQSLFLVHRMKRIYNGSVLCSNKEFW